MDWNCIAQLLAFEPCILEHATHATLRSHEAKRDSGPSVHDDGALPSHSPCVQQAHHGEALRDPQRCSARARVDSPKKTDTDDSAWDVAAARCLRKLTARLSPCACLCDSIFALWLLHVS